MRTLKKIQYFSFILFMGATTAHSKTITTNDITIDSDKEAIVADVDTVMLADATHPDTKEITTYQDCESTVNTSSSTVRQKRNTLDVLINIPGHIINGIGSNFQDNGSNEDMGQMMRDLAESISSNIDFARNQIDMVPTKVVSKFNLDIELPHRNKLMVMPMILVDLLKQTIADNLIHSRKTRKQ